MPILSNRKRELYCLERVKGRSMYEAYTLAGFNAKNRASADSCASRMEKDPEILSRIEELRAKVLPSLNKHLELQAEKAVLDRGWVLERLMKNARIAMGEETVKLTLRKLNKGGSDDPETVTVEVTDRDAAAANKALELLGKTAELRMWVEQIERRDVTDFSKMSDEELDAFIAEGESLAAEGKTLTFIGNGGLDGPVGRGVSDPP
jgi:hypothetical protein